MSEQLTKVPKVVFANANLGLSPYTFKPTEWLGEYVREADFDGVEVHPLFHCAKEVGQAALAGTIDINSLHQSFRATGHERNTNRFVNEGKASLVDMALATPAGRLLLPNMRASARYMQTVQSILGHSVPGVFYPQEDAQRDSLILETSETELKLFQPTDHVARLIGASSLVELRSLTSGRGYDGYCLDTFHGQRHYGREKAGIVSDLDRSLPNIAKNTRAMHISLNRADFAVTESHIPTREDLVDALKGRFNGRLLEMLSTVKELGSVEYVAVELTLDGLKDVTGHSKIDDLQKDYQMIGSTVKTFFSE